MSFAGVRRPRKWHSGGRARQDEQHASLLLHDRRKQPAREGLVRKGKQDVARMTGSGAAQETLPIRHFRARSKARQTKNGAPHGLTHSNSPDQRQFRPEIFGQRISDLRSLDKNPRARCQCLFPQCVHISTQRRSATENPLNCLIRATSDPLLVSRRHIVSET